MTRIRRSGALVAAAAVAVTTACSSTSVLHLDVGECLDADALVGEVANVAPVPCADPHDGEVYARLDLTGEEYPGIEAVRAAAEDFCLPQFEEFVGISYLESEADVYPLLPTEDSWTADADRAVLCIAVTPEKVEGSLAGTGR